MDDRSRVRALLVCGGRDYSDYEYMKWVLDIYLFQWGDVMIIHGAARGADLLAERWAKERQQLYAGFPAQWDKEGKRAGMKRNAEMGALSGAQEVVAFYGGRGTRNMISVARGLELPVTLWGWRIHA